MSVGGIVTVRFWRVFVDLKPISPRTWYTLREIKSSQFDQFMSDHLQEHIDEMRQLAEKLERRLAAIAARITSTVQ
jgi:hypothetical protein